MKKQFIGVFIELALFFFFAWLLSIEPLKEYGWFLGGVHGVLAPFNWVISWFSDTWFVQAPFHTTAYMIFWWISMIFMTIRITLRTISLAFWSYIYLKATSNK